MQQVLMNLLLNAVDAMPGGGDITITTENVDDQRIKSNIYTPKPGHYVLMSIRDTGLGMDEKTKERIFEPFFTTKEMGRGTGLGLASVYGIIKGHNGFIEVESAVFRGNNFSRLHPCFRPHVIEGRRCCFRKDYHGARGIFFWLMMKRGFWTLENQ